MQMDFENHCKITERMFGNRYEKVHLWLDEFASQYPYGKKYKHRKFRHHREGVEEARKLFGDIGALVAEQHIRMDNDGWLPRKKDYEIPEYED